MQSKGVLESKPAHISGYAIIDEIIRQSELKEIDKNACIDSLNKAYLQTVQKHQCVIFITIDLLSTAINVGNIIAIEWLLNYGKVKIKEHHIQVALNSLRSAGKQLVNRQRNILEMLLIHTHTDNLSFGKKLMNTKFNNTFLFNIAFAEGLHNFLNQFLNLKDWDIKDKEKNPGKATDKYTSLTYVLYAFNQGRSTQQQTEALVMKLRPIFSNKVQGKDFSLVIGSRNVEFAKFMYDTFNRDVDLSPQNGPGPLEQAVQLEDEEMVVFLRDRGAFLNRFYSPIYSPLLHRLSSEEKNLPAVRTLIRAGARFKFGLKSEWDEVIQAKSGTETYNYLHTIDAMQKRDLASAKVYFEKLSTSSKNHLLAFPRWIDKHSFEHGQNILWLADNLKLTTPEIEKVGLHSALRASLEKKDDTPVSSLFKLIDDTKDDACPSKFWYPLLVVYYVTQKKYPHFTFGQRDYARGDTAFDYACRVENLHALKRMMEASGQAVTQSHFIATGILEIKPEIEMSPKKKKIFEYLLSKTRRYDDLVYTYNNIRLIDHAFRAGCKSFWSFDSYDGTDWLIYTKVGENGFSSFTYALQAFVNNICSDSQIREIIDFFKKLRYGDTVFEPTLLDFKFVISSDKLDFITVMLENFNPYKDKQKNPNGPKLLEYAMSLRAWDVVALLVKFGAQLNVKISSLALLGSIEYCPLLKKAIIDVDFDVVKHLIAQGAACPFESKEYSPLENLPEKNDKSSEARQPILNYLKLIAAAKIQSADIEKYLKVINPTDLKFLLQGSKNPAVNKAIAWLKQQKVIEKFIKPIVLPEIKPEAPILDLVDEEAEEREEAIRQVYKSSPAEGSGEIKVSLQDPKSPAGLVVKKEEEPSARVAEMKDESVHLGDGEKKNEESPVVAAEIKGESVPLGKGEKKNKESPVVATEIKGESVFLGKGDKKNDVQVLAVEKRPEFVPDVPGGPQYYGEGREGLSDEPVKKMKSASKPINFVLVDEFPRARAGEVKQDIEQDIVFVSQNDLTCSSRFLCGESAAQDPPQIEGVCRSLPTSEVQYSPRLFQPSSLAAVKRLASLCRTNRTVRDNPELFRELSDITMDLILEHDGSKVQNCSQP